jgi:hypothetical protein
MNLCCVACLCALLLTVVGLLCIVLLSYVYFVTLCVLFYYVCIAVLNILVAGLLAKSKATSAQVFLGFPLSKSECSDGSQHSQLLLHASHVALRT